MDTLISTEVRVWGKEERQTDRQTGRQRQTDR